MSKIVNRILNVEKCKKRWKTILFFHELFSFNHRLFHLFTA